MADQAPYSVVFPRMVWERSLRRVLAVPGSYGFGGVTRNAHPEAVELLVHDLEVVTSVPAGGRQPPLTDWVLVGTTRDAAPVSVLNDTIRRFGPRSSQLLAVILAGLDADRGGWVGCVFERGQRLPLAELRIVGPGMLRALAQGAEEDETPSRFSRLIKAVGADVWGKVHRSKLALIGASRNGSTMAFQLAALGVAKLTLIDFDFLEAHHLDCNRAVTEADIGHRKADALAERLLRFRSDLALSVLPCSAADARVIDAVRGVDLLATCVDRD